MILMVDNYDSFVYNLVRYFRELDEEIVVCRNDIIDLDSIKDEKITGIVISPGPKSPKESGLCLDIIDRFKGKIPILGICLGHQCIAHYFGGDVVRGKEPVHGKVDYIEHDGSGIFNGIKNPLKVTRYHSLIVKEESLPKELKVTAKTKKDGVVMGISHSEYPIFGVQFHPEAHLTEQGHELLNNFILQCKRFNNDKNKKIK